MIMNMRQNIIIPLSKRVKTFIMSCIPAFLRRRISGRHNLQRILINIAWLSFDKVFGMAVGFVVVLWMARYLGPSQFGEYSYALALVAIFSVLASGGVDQIIKRDIVRDGDSRDEVLGSASAIIFASAIIAIILANITILAIRPEDTLLRSLVAVASSAMFFQIFSTIDYWFQSQVRVKFAVWAKNGAIVVIAIVKLTLIQLHAPVIAFMWAGVAEAALTAIGMVTIYHLSGLSVLAWRVRYGRIKYLLHQSWPLLLASIATIVYMRIDQVMLGEMLDSKAVGIYTAASRLTEFWYFLPIAIGISVFPTIVKTKNDNPEFYIDRIRKLLTVLVGLAYVVAIPVSFFSDSIVNIVFGDAYAGAGKVLTIYVWASVFVFMGVAQTLWNINENLQRIIWLRTAACAVLNVILNLILIPKYGVLGAASSSLVSHAFISYFSNLLSKETHVMFKLQSRALVLGWGSSRVRK